MSTVLKAGRGRALAIFAIVMGLLVGVFGLGLLASTAGAAVPVGKVPDNNTPQTLPFSQNWSNPALITANDDWSGVPGIEGFLGDDAAAGTGVDPRTIVVPFTTIDVIANQNNPNITNGGVAEFDGIPNPVVALQGSGTADFPHISIYLNTTGQTGINVAYNVRDIDASADNAIQQVNLQFRIGNSGNFTNVAGGYIADATLGPSDATLVTPISVLLPVTAENQPLIEVRVMTSNAVGNDEWVGIDDINITSGAVTSTPTNTVGAISTNTGTPPTATPTWSATSTPFPGGLRIHDIQGASHLSPHVSTSVSNVPGIVTSVLIAGSASGFYMQDPLPDANNATSEGIFVFTGSAPTVAVGHAVLVSGNVLEFRPGGASSSNLTTTEIGSPSIFVQSTGNPLPAPVIAGSGGRIPPNMAYDSTNCGNVETCGSPFSPDTDGIDFWESLEGMRVQVNNAVVVGPTAQFTGGLPNREVYVIGDNGANANVRTTRGGLVIRPNDQNPERVVVTNQFVTIPDLNVSDSFTQPIVGIMSYNFGKFLLNATTLPPPVFANLPREITSDPGPNQLTIGNFNVENLAPADPITKFNNLANQIVINMKAPDVISIQEIQDNNGTTNDSVVAADVTWGMLITAIQNNGGPTYDYRQIDPVDDQDGGAPGGNIRQGFLFRTDRGLAFIDRPGGGPITHTQVLTAAGEPYLEYSPGRLDPTNPAFSSSRKPLAGEFTYNGHKLFLVANHWNSKGGDEPLFSKNQPPILGSEPQRIQQANVVSNTVGQILAYNSNALIGVIGDLNDFEWSPPLMVLRNIGLFPMIETLPVPERYSYVFVGNSQSLDHEVVSPALLAADAGYNSIHVNSEYAIQDSDHEPEVGKFFLPAGATATPTGTSTPLATNTATRTNTSVPPTSTSTSTSTRTSTSTSTSTTTNTSIPATATGTACVIPAQPMLLIPDWTADRVMVFDPQDGHLVNANFIVDPDHLDSPKNAIMSAAGNSVLMADQIGDVVNEYAFNGAWLRVFAPAGGPNPAILDNIRGITLRPNGNLLVTVGGGGNNNAVAEFDTNGNYLGNFVAAGSGGLSSPFDVHYRVTDYLVTSTGGSTGALRYDPTTGAFLGMFAPIVSFPQQIHTIANGNVLVADFSGADNGIVEYTSGGTFIARYTAVTGNRGVYELGNGNLLTTNGTGVYEITRAGAIVDTEATGVNAQYIEYVVAPGGACTTPSATRTATNTPTATNTRTATSTRTITPTRTNTAVPPTSTNTSILPTGTNTTIPSTGSPTAASTVIVSATATVTCVPGGAQAWVTETPMPNVRAYAAGAVVGNNFYAISGFNGSAPDASVARYDTVTHVWTSLSPVPTPVSQARGAALGTKIYLAGGFNNGFGGQTTGMQIYDTVAGTWSLGAPLPEARAGAGVAAVNGKIYVIAGFGPGFATRDTVYEYDPVANSYLTRAPAPAAEGNVAVGVLNDLIYTIGGSATFMHYVYNPATNTWANIAAGLTPNFQTPGVFALGGEIWAVGGTNGFSPYPPNQQVQIYNPGTDSWRFGPVLNIPRYGSSAAGAVNNRGYIAGGIDSTTSVYLSSVESIGATVPCGPTPTVTPAGSTPTVTRTNTATNTPVSTSTSIATNTPVNTSTNTPTNTPSNTPTNTPTSTNTTIPSATPTACIMKFRDVRPEDWFYGYVEWMYCNGIVSGYITTPPCDAGQVPCFKPGNPTTRGQMAKIVVLAFRFPIDTTGGPHFSDVPPGHTFYDYIETGRNLGLFTGYADGTYRPNVHVTRGQIAKIVVNAAIMADPANWTLEDPPTNTFQDVPVGSTFFRWIETAYSHHILSGYPCGVSPTLPCVPPGNKPYFIPGADATRAQISKIVFLAVNYPPQR